MQTITVRASSWGALFDCAFRWEGVHLLKMR
ncbi:PD-(D/E)XK nuclease family protein, partial [Pseudomonas aeruginosa]|nr:PD-(D/E)XK nuclease family protein [Pseudomonas aeruginosa]ELH1111135.1 PD-(D/E)XK nuclease family protein [Pseudomonas aeruginosa]ELU0709707.1 PD-(D/E)XK nuclease family protein [Pseudomonas aeruginosa]